MAWWTVSCMSAQKICLFLMVSMGYIFVKHFRKYAPTDDLDWQFINSALLEMNFTFLKTWFLLMLFICAFNDSWMQFELIVVFVSKTCWMWVVFSISWWRFLPAIFLLRSSWFKSSLFCAQRNWFSASARGGELVMETWLSVDYDYDLLLLLKVDGKPNLDFECFFERILLFWCYLSVILYCLDDIVGLSFFLLRVGV